MNCEERERESERNEEPKKCARRRHPREIQTKKKTHTKWTRLEINRNLLPIKTKNEKKDATSLYFYYIRLFVCWYTRCVCLNENTE